MGEGVPQGSVLILYLLYTSDLPQIENVTVSKYTDFTAMRALASYIDEATNKLQQSNDQIYCWIKNSQI